MSSRWYVAGGVVLLLSACAGPTRVALTPEVRQQLTDVSAKSIVWQDEVVVQAANPGATAALGGGLIGALIDSSVSEGRQNTIQAMINPFYAAVDDVDFRKDLWSALDTSFKGDYALKLNGFTKTALRSNKNPAADLPKGRSVLLVNTEYTLTPDYSRLNMTTWATVWQSGVDKPVYLNQFIYQSSATGAGNTESIKQWSANKGERYRNVIAEGIAETVAMLKLDLASGATDSAQAKSVVLKKVDGAATLNVTGPVLSEQSGRVIARHSDGHVYSLAN
jgi:hypothetical protein